MVSAGTRGCNDIHGCEPTRGSCARFNMAHGAMLMFSKVHLSGAFYEHTGRVVDSFTYLPPMRQPLTAGEQGARGSMRCVGTTADTADLATWAPQYCLNSTSTRIK